MKTTLGDPTFFYYLNGQRINLTNWINVHENAFSVGQRACVCRLEPGEHEHTKLGTIVCAAQPVEHFCYMCNSAATHEGINDGTTYHLCECCWRACRRRACIPYKGYVSPSPTWTGD